MPLHYRAPKLRKPGRTGRGSTSGTCRAERGWHPGLGMASEAAGEAATDAAIERREELLADKRIAYVKVGGVFDANMFRQGIDVAVWLCRWQLQSQLRAAIGAKHGRGRQQGRLITGAFLAGKDKLLAQGTLRTWCLAVQALLLLLLAIAPS